MRSNHLFLLTTSLVSVAAFAQKPTTDIIKYHLKMAMVDGLPSAERGKVSVTGVAANVKDGKAALRYDYPIAKGKLSFLAHSVPDGGLVGAKSIRFWVKSDYTTPIIVSLQEKEGGRWNAGFTAPQNAWQRVELIPSDFDPSDGQDDPKDPNGKLDLEKVEGVGLVDVGRFSPSLKWMRSSPKFSD